MENKRKLESAYASDISSENPASIAQIAAPSIAEHTEEGRRQRRFDSLARVLSLGSSNSACAAVTIVEDELIIAANCADDKSPLGIAQLLQKRLTTLRNIILRHAQSPLAENMKSAVELFKIDVNTLKAEGGLFQTPEVISQALYKLIKSIYSKDDLSTDDFAFTPEEINIIGSSANITILVAGEQEQTVEEEEIDFADCISSASTPFYNKDDSTSSAAGTDHSFTTSSSSSAHDFSITSPVMMSPGNFSSSSWLSSEKSSNHKSRKGIVDEKYRTSKSGKTSGFGTFWHDKNEQASSDVDTEALDASFTFSVQDFLLDSLDESILSQKNASSTYSDESHNTVQYAMNVYQHERIKECIPFPMHIYSKRTKPQGSSAFHAEQLIAFYLKDSKKINLHDTEASAIPIGISKLCCLACTILYKFPRIKLRGTSFNNIKGVPNIISEQSEERSASSGATPKKRNGERRTAHLSPWT